ncbi:MAG: hypothetical protein ACR2M0_14975 [Chloroflexia bacterium]
MPAKPDTEGQEAEILSEAEDSGLNVAPETLRRMVTEEEERRELIREFISRNLKSGTDYGTISLGRRESKPSLFKPGAEKICLLFQLRPSFEADRSTLEMAGSPPGLFAYICRLVDRQDRVVGEGRGAAELTERAGWTVNTAIKICEKRAQVDAVLRVAGLSEIFTQDLEDMEQRGPLAYEKASRAGTGYVAEAGAAPADQQSPEAEVEPKSKIEEPKPEAEAEPKPKSENPKATEQQQRAIRALLPGSGLSEDELTASMKVGTLGELTQARATRVIERLREKAKERTETPPF